MASLSGTRPNGDHTTTLIIYDVSGTLVRQVQEDVDIYSTLSLGLTREIGWDGKTDDGRIASAGIYLYRMVSLSTSGEGVEKTGKFVIIR